jgi:hypothetical protein
MGQVREMGLAPVAPQNSVSLQAPVAECDVLPAPARPMRPPSRTRHCTARTCATALKSLPRAPWPSQIARLSSSRARARCATPAGASAAKYGKCIDTSIFLFPRGKFHQKLSETRWGSCSCSFHVPPRGTFQIRQLAPASQKAGSLGSTGCALHVGVAALHTANNTDTSALPART